MTIFGGSLTNEDGEVKVQILILVKHRKADSLNLPLSKRVAVSIYQLGLIEESHLILMKFNKQERNF